MRSCIGFLKRVHHGVGFTKPRGGSGPARYGRLLCRVSNPAPGRRGSLVRSKRKALLNGHLVLGTLPDQTACSPRHLPTVQETGSRAAPGNNRNETQLALLIEVVGRNESALAVEGVLYVASWYRGHALGETASCSQRDLKAFGKLYQLGTHKALPQQLTVQNCGGLF